MGGWGGVGGGGMQVMAHAGALPVDSDVHVAILLPLEEGCSEMEAFHPSTLTVN